MDIMECFDNEFKKELDKFLEKDSVTLSKEKENLVFVKEVKKSTGKKRGRKSKEELERQEQKAKLEEKSKKLKRPNALVGCIAGSIITRDRLVFVDNRNRQITMITSKNFVNACMVEGMQKGHIVEQSFVVCLFPNADKLVYVPIDKKIKAIFSTISTGVVACNVSNSHGKLVITPMKRVDIDISNFIKEIDKRVSLDLKVIEDIEMIANK